MTGDTLLKMMSVLTPDNVRQLKAAGSEDDVRTWLATFDRMAIEWRQRDYGRIDSQVWNDIQIKLSELRAALGG